MSKTAPTPLHADLSGRICLVTGASAGIGKEIARNLARLGATLILACRTPSRAQAARDEIIRDTGNKEVSVMQVDLSDQGSIRAFAAEFSRAHPALHVLVNSAGGWYGRRQLSADGIEMTWATNVLGLHLLTDLLLDLLQKSAPARVVNIASHLTGGLDLSDVQFARRRYKGFSGAYYQSKQAMLMLNWAQAQKMADSGVTVNAAGPGWVRTEAHRNAPWYQRLVMNTVSSLFALTPRQGADTPTWVAASPELEGVSGKLWQERKEQPPLYQEPAQIEALVALCEEMTAPKPSPAAPKA